ncbi:MerR family transcriptional regulator [Evansella sp. AB-rgal1]
MQIKEFASKYKVTKDAVRYYEKENLMEPIRLANGYRMYDEIERKT